MRLLTVLARRGSTESLEEHASLRAVAGTLVLVTAVAAAVATLDNVSAPLVASAAATDSSQP